MKPYNLEPKANSESAAVSAFLNQLPVLCISFMALFVFLISFSGCSVSDDSSDEEGQTSVNTTNTSYSAPGMAMNWNPEPPGLYEKTISLYEDGIPNSIPSDIEETSLGEGTDIIYWNVSVPTLTIYLPPPDIANGTAVIYCPGGGYACEGYGDGITIANELNKQGIAAFILKYRLPSDSTMEDKTIGPLQDAQQAIKIVRQQAEKWGIDPDKVGIMGASSGGHLACTAGTHFNKSYIPNEENINLRPDFMILVSSVISMVDEITHQQSKKNLLGEDPSENLVELFSDELQITENTPPTWLIHAKDDTTVSVENSILLYEGLTQNSIPARMDIYPAGSHSLFWSIFPDEWMQNLLEWMTTIGMITSE